MFTHAAVIFTIWTDLCSNFLKILRIMSLEAQHAIFYVFFFLDI